MTAMIDVARRGHDPRPEVLSTRPFALATCDVSDDAPLRGGHGAEQAQTGGAVA